MVSAGLPLDESLRPRVEKLVSDVWGQSIVLDQELVAALMEAYASTAEELDGWLTGEYEEVGLLTPELSLFLRLNYGLGGRSPLSLAEAARAAGLVTKSGRPETHRKRAMELVRLQAELVDAQRQWARSQTPDTGVILLCAHGVPVKAVRALLRDQVSWSFGIKEI
jgi:broad specificity phosphatase PhoE